MVDTNFSYRGGDVHKPSDHMLYSKANCLVLDLDAEHWQNECTSNHGVFGIGNNKCDHCSAVVISVTYTNLFPSMFARYSCCCCQGNVWQVVCTRMNIRVAQFHSQLRMHSVYKRCKTFACCKNFLACT